MHEERLVRALAVGISVLAAGCALTANEAPPLENGVYIVRGVCFGEGECNRYWRASATVDLRARPDPASPVVATVAPDEWVEAINGQYRFVPRRGVVHTATETPPLAVGDVVYMLEPLGEGSYVLWRRGQTLDHDWAAGWDNEPITWDADAEAPRGAVLGSWVQLRLDNGQTGWIESPREFECMGPLQGSTDCRG